MAAITKPVSTCKKPAVASLTISIVINIVSVALAFWFGDFVAPITALVFYET
jgi:hypothetical protein